MSLPPDEDWVVLTYIDGSGAVQESRFEWDVIDPRDARQLHGGSASADPRSAARGSGVDVKTELLRRVRKALFDPPAVKAEAEMAAYRRPARRSGASAGATARTTPPRADVSILPDVYPYFGPVTTPSGTSATSGSPRSRPRTIRSIRTS